MNGSNLFAVRGCWTFVCVLSLVTVSLPVYAVSSQDIIEKLRAGNLDDVEASYATLQAQRELNQDGLRPLSVAYGQFPIRQDLLPLLDAWCERHPSSPFAFTQRGEFYLGYAWLARGAGWGRTVDKESYKIFRERIERAKQDFGQATILNPTAPYPPACLITVAMVERGELEAAREALEHAHTLKPADTHLSAQLISVETVLQESQKQMEEHFERAVKFDPMDDTAYARKLMYLMPKWGGSEQAMFEFAREASANAPRGSRVPMVLIEAHLEKAYMLDRMGQFSRLEQAQAQPSRTMGEEIRDYFRYPEVWAEVEGVFRRLLEDFPSSDHLHGWFGLVAAYAGNEEAAKTHFGLVKGFTLLAEAADSDEIKNFKWAYKSLGRLADLERGLLAWRAADPEDPRPYAELAALSQELGEKEKAHEYHRQAVEAYKQLITFNPGDKDAYFFLAWEAYDSDPDLSIEYLKKLIEMAPQDPRGYGSLAYIYIRKKKMYDEAKKLLEVGLLLDPTSAQMRDDLATVLSEHGDKATAVEQYQASLSLNPDDAVTHFNLAQTFYDQGRLDDAIKEYQEAIRLYPTYVEAYYNLGFANYDLGRFSQAISAFERFILSDPPQYPELVEKARGLVREMRGKIRQ